MKQLVVILVLCYSTFGYCQNKAGIFDYGNPSILIAPAIDTNKTEITNYLLKTNQITFNEEEDHIYIRTNDDFNYFKSNPEKRIFADCDLLSQQVTMLTPDELPKSRKGRSILALFTPNTKLPAFRNEKREREGWLSELWITNDLKVNVGANFRISILDTTNKKVSEIKLPNPVNDYKEDRFKYTKEKPKDFDVDLGFCYYAKANLLYICASWGFRFPDEAERIWQKLKSGDSLYVVQLMDTFILRSPDLVLSNYKKGDSIKSYIKVLEIFSNDSIAKIDYEKQKERQLQKEMAVITAYLGQQNIKTTRTASGAFVQVITEGTGSKIDSGSVVYLMYKGMTLDGVVFDSNMDDSFGHTEPLELTAGIGNYIKGFEEGLALLREGSVANIYIPSMLGYAERPLPSIEPYTNLLYEVRIQKVTK